MLAQLSRRGRVDGNGHETTVAVDGARAPELAPSGAWDLVLLDVMLPRWTAFEVCGELRRAGVMTPIILLTARTQGGRERARCRFRRDDYVTKPFSLRGLRTRVRAQLRRHERIAARTYRFGECALVHSWVRSV